jgi:hypothetical protein
MVGSAYPGFEFWTRHQPKAPISLHLGDQLELIQPRGWSMVLLRFRCTDFGDFRATGRDPARGTPIGVLGADIDPELIEPGAMLRAATSDGP